MRPRNEISVPPGRDLSALGIVSKEQGSARCAIRQNSPNFQIAFFNISFTVLLLRALMHEFARVSQAIIHGAVQFRKLPEPSFR
jgi:hypothetical protein